MFKFLRTIGLFLCLAAFLSSTKVLAQRGPIPVEVAPVVSRTLQEEVSFIATLEADISTTVGAVVSGLIVKSDVREGDRVVAKKPFSCSSIGLRGRSR